MDMDPFTARMLERARARREKLDKKLCGVTGDSATRAPLAENVVLPKKTEAQSGKNALPSSSAKPKAVPSRKSSGSSSKVAEASPRKSSNGTSVKKRLSASPRKSIGASKTAKTRDLQPVESETSTTSTASDSKPVIVGDVTKDSATFEINILNNCDDMILNIQVEEKEVKLSEYLKQKREEKSVIRTLPNSNVTVITSSSKDKENKCGGTVVTASKDDTKADIRDGVKSRLQRLGVLYSDNETLSSPIHRTEEKFNAASPKQSPSKGQNDRASKVKKYGRLAALADQINNWEDDVTHHQYGTKCESTDVPPAKESPASITQSPTKPKQVSNAAIQQPKSPVTKPALKPAFNKPSPSKLQGNRPTGMLDKRLVDALEGAGYRLSTGRSRLVYDFGMAPVALDIPQPQPALVKRPSLKKYKAPLPPNQAPPPPTPPIVDQPNHQVKNVLAKATMFEGSSPRQRDPAEMSLRERKALFEKNNAVALVPKAPFGQAPSAKQLNSAAVAAANKAGSSCRVTTNSAPPKPTTAPPPPPKQASSASPAGNSGAGIRGKLAALFTTTTISGKEIADKAKSERDKEMNMLLNRFQHHDRGAAPGSPGQHPNGEDDSSEKSPLIGDRFEEPPLQMHRKPEIVSNIPKLHDSSSNSEPKIPPTVLKSTDSDSSDSVIGQQPSKRRSSQSSTAKVSAVLDDVKRIRVSGESNGALPDGRIYPHLSDIETATSSAPEESSECGGSSLDISSEEYTASLQQKSSEFGNTSFGRDLLAVVQNKRLHTKTETTQAKVDNRDSEDSNSEENTLDSDMDDILDDAFDDAVQEDYNEDDDGPTESKINKSNVPVASDSFSYRHGAVKRLREEEEGTFKSPLKASGVAQNKNGSLYHSVSVYRKKQNEELKPAMQIRTLNQQTVPSPDKSGSEKQSRQEMVALIKEKISQLSSEVNKQQTIISQASQALNLCAATVEFNQSTEQAEGERLLLLATHRRHALLNEIQRLKVEGDPRRDESTVTVTISSITVPLRRDYIRKLNADGVVGHHVVALVKCGVRVIATAMKTTAHNNYTIAFPEVIELDGLPSDFKVTIEIYLLQASPEILPHDVKYHIVKKGSKLLTPKSKSSSELRTPKIQSPCGPNAVRSTQFLLHGYSIFAVEQVKRTSFSLNKVPSGSPLEGALGVNVKLIKARPPAPAPHSAFLTIFRSVSGLGAWNRRWARLHEHHLNFWTYPDDEKTKIPSMTIDLSECVNDKVIIAPRDICARTNTILFDTKVPQGCPVDPNSLTIVYNENDEPRMRYLLAADTKEERQEWLNLLNAALEYSRSVNE